MKKTSDKTISSKNHQLERPSKDNELYSTDSPIFNPDLDEFNRKYFSERIAQTIANRKDSKSLVIGIYGKWGEGKTTVLNFIDNELKRHNNIATIFFNPWMFPSETELLIAFYTELAKGIETSLSTGKEKIGQVITDYLAPFAGLLDKIDSAEKIGKLLSNVRLDELRDRIGKFLIEKKKLVVVFMDDIDRLDKDEIHAVFRLIKLSANFENIVYVLAFDREIVEDALSERYFSKKESAGQNFLEKIIQVPINLPKIQQADIRRFFFKRVDEILKQAEIEITENEVQEFVRGFDEGIEVKLETPRMALRYINMLNFSLPLVKGEVNIAEFLLIEAIRAFYPSAYEIVKENKDAFTATSLGGLNSHQPEIDRFKKVIEKAFTDSDEEKNNLKKLLTILFPRLETIFGNTTYRSEWDKTWAQQKRISSHQYFDRYFAFSVPTNDVSDVEIENLIKSLDKLEVKDLIKKFGDRLNGQNSGAFIAKLRQKVDLFSPVSKIKLAISLALFGGRFSNPNQLFSFDTPFSRGATLISRLIESSYKDEQTTELGEKIVQIAEPITFALEIIRMIRTPRVENEPDTIPTNAKEKISKSFAARIEAMANDGVHLLDDFPEQAASLIWFWGKFGSKESVDGYLVNILKDTKNIHKLINSIVPIAYPVDGSLPNKSDFNRDQYNFLQNFVDLDMVYEVLNKTYDGELESEQYPYDDGNSIDLRIAKQFAWIHKKVLSEKQTFETNQSS